MQTKASDRELAINKTADARDHLRENCDLLDDDDVRFKAGGEQMPLDGAPTIFRHQRLAVMGDMNDMRLLTAISRVCDLHGLQVDESNDEMAILQVDWSLL